MEVAAIARKLRAGIPVLAGAVQRMENLRTVERLSQRGVASSVDPAVLQQGIQEQGQVMSDAMRKQLELEQKYKEAVDAATPAPEAAAGLVIGRRSASSGAPPDEGGASEPASISQAAQVEKKEEPETEAAQLVQAVVAFEDKEVETGVKTVAIQKTEDVDGPEVENLRARLNEIWDKYGEKGGSGGDVQTL